MRKVLIIFGMPGSGKGTQKDRIKEKYDLSSITVGDILREKAKTDPEVKELLRTGKLFPDEKVEGFLKEEVEKLKGREFIFDGFPRKASQLKMYERLASDYSFETIAILLNISEEESVKRLGKRYVCDSCDNVSFKEGRCKCGGKLVKRVDDREEAVKVRFRAYREETVPILNYYREKGQLIEINGVGTFDEVTNRIFEKLDDRFKD